MKMVVRTMHLFSRTGPIHRCGSMFVGSPHGCCTPRIRQVTCRACLKKYNRKRRRK